MKKVTLTLLLVACILITAKAQQTPDANSTLFWSMTVQTKLDKRLEWEKKFLTFVKSHYPSVKFRTYEIITGVNSGGYVVVMGPMSYKDMDAFPPSVKGETLAKTEGQALDALCNSVVVNHFRRVNELSTANSQRKLKYVVVSYSEITPGTWGDVSDYLKRQKEAREKGGSSADVDIFRPSNSGPGNSYASVRYVEKLEELESGNFNMNESYDKLFGNNSFIKDVEKYFSVVRQNQSEIRVLRPDLSVM
jgi:hypothetical protein